MRSETELLTATHEVASFSCGKQALDDFLKRFALANQANGSVRTYVAQQNGRVVGYYSLAAGSVAYERASERITKGLARHEVPVILMARFAVDRSVQGQGWGRRLFFDALLRSLNATEAIGARAFVVHAKDEEARAFYQKFNMVPAPDNPFHLFLLFKDVRATLR